MTDPQNTLANTDYDPHWAQTQQHATDISDLKSGQARLEVGVSNLGDRLASGFAGLQSSLNATNKPTPWVPIGSLIVSIMVLLGGVVIGTFSIITANMQRESDLRFQHVQTEFVEYAKTILRLENALTTTRISLQKTETGLQVWRDCTKNTECSPN